MRVLVVGDSHTRAIKRALDIRAGSRRENVDIEVRWLESGKSQSAENVRASDLTIADARELVKALRPPDVLAFSLLGTFHNVYGLLRHDPPFRIQTVDSIPAGDHQVAMIPESVFLDFFETASAPSHRLRTVREAATCRVCHLSTPPPKEDNSFLESKMQKYRDRVVAEAGLNPPCLRLRLWQIEMKALRSVCAKMNVDFLEAPKEALSAKGFLDQSYQANDATHANHAYGELVLRQLEDFAQAAGAGGL